MSDRSQVSIDTVAAVANQMTEWLDRETCDGLIVAPDTVPEAFVQQLVPALKELNLASTRFADPTRPNASMTEPPRHPVAAMS